MLLSIKKISRHKKEEGDELRKNKINRKDSGTTKIKAQGRKREK